MKMRTGTRLGALIASTALILSACGGDSADEIRLCGDSEGDLVIGYLLPETGALAFLGPPMITGVQLAVCEVNDADGSVRINLLSADEAGDAARASEEAGRLIAAGVTAIVGAASSAMTVAVLDQVTGAGVLQCSPSNTGVNLTFVPDKGLYFRTAPSDALQGPVLATQVLDAGHETVAIASRAEDYGRGLLQETAAAIVRQGGEVVYEDLFDPEAATYDDVVSGMLASGADAFVVIAFDEGAQIVRGLLAAGITTDRLFGGDGMAGIEFLALVDETDPNILDGMTFTAPTATTSDEFAAKLAGYAPNLGTLLYAANSYDCVNLIALSAVVAGSTASAAMRDQMFGVTLGDNKCSSFVECVEFLNNGQTIAYQSAAGGPLNLIEVREGGGEPSRGVIDISRWIDGEFVTIDQVSGDLLN